MTMIDGPYKELPYGKYRVKWGDHKCDLCGQPEYAEFEVTPTGYSSGTHIDHRDDCQIFFCRTCKERWENCNCDRPYLED